MMMIVGIGLLGIVALLACIWSELVEIRKAIQKLSEE